MGTSVFGKEYSELYDVLYETKDYSAECDFVQSLIEEDVSKSVSILDIGCGTGGHLIPLTERRYKVSGIDKSLHMIDVARQRCAEADITAKLMTGDIRTFSLKEKFDIALSLFAVLSYITEDEDLSAAFKNVHTHLNPQGVFIFDVWYGPGVKHDTPRECIKRFKNGVQEIIRLTEPTHDSQRNLIHINFDLIAIEKSALVNRVQETHTVRYFFEEEMRAMLNRVGFSSVSLCPFMKPHGTLSHEDWYMTVIASK
ncbi:TPA: SAM-dependent methyltransferase [Candidatus Peribacteria bacterium]|nr:SAM-dependent methyltransferase [Candidatus Peribacteria bacterium]